MVEIKFRAFLRSNQRLPNGITLGYEKFSRGIYEVMDLNLASEIVTLWSEKEQTSFEVSFRKVELMQYTGLKDKNGVEIAVGDVVKKSNGAIGQVVYLKATAGYKLYSAGQVFDIFESNARYLEAIGNIYENPELLKG
ncbi:YopX family protein [uncultured Campylobacter sp.]|uniref:YopX family protein n=1 Tax=uncultured Campylobacter sp. TaxID=218934 RepID=UPI002617E7BC|nr:YopX family protein [uncultured Campylobacter sp.]